MVREVVAKFEDECVLSYVATIDNSTSSVTELDYQLFELEQKKRRVGKEIKELTALGDVKKTLTHYVETNLGFMGR